MPPPSSNIGTAPALRGGASLFHAPRLRKPRVPKLDVD
jgi:hypothetical protein